MEDNNFYNGLILDPGEEPPEMGNIECVSREGGIVSFEATSDDEEILRNLKHKSMGPGTNCMFLDTGKYARYHAKLQKWYSVGEGVF